MKIVSYLLLLLLALPITADAAFTQAEIQRLTEARNLLKDSEMRSVNDLIEEFESTGFPDEHLEIYEAVAKTFRDIDNKYGQDNPESRKQLLGKIKLNMAYFQLGGSTQEQSGGSELNRLIQRKLKHYLPENIWGHPKLFHSLD